MWRPARIHVSTMVFLVFMQPALVNGDALRQVFSCQRDRGNKVTNDHVLLRAFPLNVQSVEIPRRGESLLSVLSKQDVLAVAIQQLRLGSDIEKDNARNRFILGAKKTDEFSLILHVRNREVTVFPRVMLVHPTISFARIKPNDFLATLSVSQKFFLEGTRPEPYGRVERLNLVDPVHRWLHERLGGRGDQGPIKIRIKSELLPTSKTGWYEFSLPRNATELTFLLGKNSLGKYLQPESIGEQLAVSVVSRHEGNYVIRYVTPLQFGGAFSERMKYHALLRHSPVEKDDPIDWYFESLLRISLRENDEVAVTNISSMPLFREYAVVTP